MDDPTLIAFALIGLVISGGIGGALLQKSNREPIGFALGFFLGPIGLIIAAIMRNDSAAHVAQTMKKCPHCAEAILVEARKCRYCGSDVASVVAITGQPTQPATGPAWWRCLQCKTQYQREFEVCPSCWDSRREHIAAAR